MVHLSPWALLPGLENYWLALGSPYAPAFVTDIKEGVPGYARKWIPELKLWLIRADYEEELRLLLRKHYRPVEMCPDCVAKRECWFWQRSRLSTVGGPVPWTPSTPPPRTSPPPRPRAARPTAHPDRAALAALLLEVELPVTVQELKSAYRKKALVYHPDRGGTQDAFILLQRAYETILNSSNVLT